MSVDITVETVIACPRAAVFAYITAVENDPLWTSGLVEVTRLTDGPLRVGSKISRVSRFLGTRIGYDIEIIGLEDGSLVDMNTTGGPFPMKVRYLLDDVDGGTRMRIHTSGDPGGLFKLTGPLLSGAVKRQIGLDLANLKDLLEQEG